MTSESHDELRRELERSILLTRRSSQRRYSSARRAAFVVAIAGLLGTGVAVAVFLLTGPGRAEPPPPPPPSPTATTAAAVPTRRASPPMVTGVPPVAVPPRSGLTSPGRSQGYRVQTVQRGDTVARIAVRERVPIEQIVADNHLTNPDRIKPGRRLVLRPAPHSTEVIAPGTTLTHYARRHGLDVSELMGLNPQITDPNRIRAGGRLRVAR